MIKMRNFSKAFTLIEMLISIVLMALIISTMMFAFKYSLSQFNRIGSLVPKKAIYYDQFRGVISGMFPYPVDVQRGFEKRKLEPFIYLKEKEMLFISKNPIYNREISIIKIECKDDKLNYYEKILYSKNSDYLAPVIEDIDFKKSYFDDLKECDFRYDFVEKKETPSLITLFIQNSKESLEFNFTAMIDMNNTKNILILRDPF